MLKLAISGHLYRSVYSDENLTEAWHKVRTQGSEAAGIDGVSRPQFQRYLFRELRALQRELKEQRYRPQSAKLVYINKDGGGKRPIGILTVRERVVQRAVLNVIEPLFEAEFDESSYGFRPGRSVQMALDHVSRLVNHGHLWVVKLDIEQCFESINLAKLQRFIARKIKDRRVRKLIHAWLMLEPVQLGRRGIVQKKQPTGLLQGSPLSPFLANVYLDQFDKMARRKGLCTIRYADDLIVLCRTISQAKKALRKVEKLLASLDLALNPHKARILHVEEGLSFLGGTLVFEAGEDGDGRWIPSFPASIGEPELDEAAEAEFIPADFEALLEEVSKHRDGHPVYR